MKVKDNTGAEWKVQLLIVDPEEPTAEEKAELEETQCSRCHQGLWIDPKRIRWGVEIVCDDCFEANEGEDF